MSERGGGTPGAPPRIPGLPANAHFFELGQFRTLNAQRPRPSIGDQEMAWCQNLMPVGEYYLRALGDNSAPIFGSPIPAFQAYAVFLGPLNAPCVSPKVIFLTAGTTSWTVPADWNNADNTIECIGGGGGGAGSGTASPSGHAGGVGGQGGAYSRISNVTLTPGAVIPVSVGAGGAGGTGDCSGDGATAGGNTYFGSPKLVQAIGGAPGKEATPGNADQSIGAIGAALHFGGVGGSYIGAQINYPACGGGGAAGPLGNGSAGGSVMANPPALHFGAGGGGNGGGLSTAGAAGGNSGPGQGGTASDGTAGGLATISGQGNGTNGSGGSGSFSSASPLPGGAGGNGNEWDSTHGSGGGGGGGATSSAFPYLGSGGGPGGAYGGGGGGGSLSAFGTPGVYCWNGGNGANGVIRIFYCPAV